MQVSRSGYYKWRTKRPSNRDNERKQMIKKVQDISKLSRSNYGSRRISESLRDMGYRCGRYKARTLMGLANVVAKQRRRHKSTTQSNHTRIVSSNMLNRKFSVLAPNTAWVGDITYIRTLTGWLYLAVVIDLFSRRESWLVNEHSDAF